MEKETAKASAGWRVCQLKRKSVPVMRRKELGSALRNLKRENQGLGKRGKLNYSRIDKLQKYYWIAIWANVGNGWTENMLSMPVFILDRNAWRSPKKLCVGGYLCFQHEFGPPVVYYEIFGHPTSVTWIWHTFPLNSNKPTVTQFVWPPCVKNWHNGSRNEHWANRY